MMMTMEMGEAMTGITVEILMMILRALIWIPIPILNLIQKEISQEREVA